MTRSDVLAPVDAERFDWLEAGQFPLDWNGPSDRTYVPFDDRSMDRPIMARFERMVREHPHRIAVTDGDLALTYSEAWDGLSGLAETIAARTRPGELVGILLPACAKFPLAMLACLAAGRPFVALDPHYPLDWLGKVLEDARPVLVITQTGALESLEVCLSGIDVIRLDGLPRAAQAGWRPAEFGSDLPACVLFTSGSTGRPKGIVNSQRNLLRRVAQSVNASHINAEDRFLTLASLCTIVGVRDVMTALLAGASIRLVDPQRIGAREILNVIQADGVTILFAFPALLRSVLASNPVRAAETLRLIRVGGDTMVWSDLDLLRARLAPNTLVQLIYAATEAPIMQWFVDDSYRGDDARIPIGYPLPGNQLAVVDENGGRTPPGEIGELVVGGAYVALGLWADGRFTSEKVECGSAPSTRLFRTGDLVRHRPDGLLERVGRKDRQVKIRGVRVDLDAVESILRRHPSVHDVGVVARNTAPGAAILVAYVSIRDGAPAKLLEDLREAMRKAPAHMRPAHYYPALAIPRLPSSKLDVQALRTLDEAHVRRGITGDDAATSRPIEGSRIAKTVAQIWRDVLGASPRGPDDDFFESGGDSLRAITFTLEVEQALGLELPVTLVNEAPTFGRFCEALRADRVERYTPLVLLKAGEILPPVFFIHGVGGNVTEILPMARRMPYAGAVFGIQARGLAGPEPPHASVEAMAISYLREIKAKQPRGPYHLCGYSFGGLVAFEMAKRLSATGDAIGLVGLFDTMMSPVKWPMRSWLSIVCRRVARPAARTDRNSPGPEGPPASELLKFASARALRVASSALIASAKYRPGCYQGRLTLFSPREREPGLPSLEAVWRRHARALTIVETAGTHSTMLSAANAESTGACLSKYLPTR